MRRHLVALLLAGFLRVCWSSGERKCGDWIGRCWSTCDGRWINYYMVRVEDGRVCLVDPADVERSGNI